MSEPKIKKPLTDKQKAARIKNLENGRKKRMEMIQQKKAALEDKEGEYDLSSNDDFSSESDNDDFIISRASSKKKPKIDVKKSKPRNIHNNPDQLKNEVNELKSIVMELATLQKKQHKARKHVDRPSGGTKIVVLPNNGAGQPKTCNDSVIEALRRTLM
jgi:hypothetical protein